MATAAAITQAKLPNNSAEDSYNILPALLGQDTKPIRPYTLHQTMSLALAIRKGDWKYLDHKGSGGNNYSRPGEWGMKQYALPEKAPDALGQLYNLKTDRSETRDVSAVATVKFKRLSAQMKQIYASVQQDTHTWPAWEWPRYEHQRIQWPAFRGAKKVPLRQPQIPGDFRSNPLLKRP